MHDDLEVTDLLTRARNGDQQAWDAVVKRFAPLIWSICRRHKLRDADVEDVGQTVWLRLVDNLDDLRVPAALPGWLVTTTRRECTRVQRDACRSCPLGPGIDAENIPDERTVTGEHKLLLAERDAAVRKALARLPLGCQRLLALLTADPRLSYAEISARLGMAVGSIGPNRARCLDRLRRDPAIAALIDIEGPDAIRQLASACA